MKKWHRGVENSVSFKVRYEENTPNEEEQTPPYNVLYRWFSKRIPQVQAEELASLSDSD